MDHGEKAQALFLEGCNCAQAVFTAFCDVTGFTNREAMALASSFGGGVGRMREICGALSGAFLAMGWLYGYEEPGTMRKRPPITPGFRNWPPAFREQHGAIQCRALLDHPDTGRHTHPTDRGLLPQPPLRPTGPGRSGLPGPLYGGPSSCESPIFSECVISTTGGHMGSAPTIIYRRGA